MRTCCAASPPVALAKSSSSVPVKGRDADICTRSHTRCFYVVFYLLGCICSCFGHGIPCQRLCLSLICLNECCCSPQGSTGSLAGIGKDTAGEEAALAEQGAGSEKAAKGVTGKAVRVGAKKGATSSGIPATQGVAGSKPSAWSVLQQGFTGLAGK
jgi:hypothetical protein